jgi:hypothetical protein
MIAVSYGLFVLCLAEPIGWLDGSLVILENSNKQVTAYTKSDITHVAILQSVSGFPWVYEATPSKVRRVPLPEYWDEISRLNESRTPVTRMWIMEPWHPYTPDQLIAMQAYLDEQLGRRYSVEAIVRGGPAEGIHCAEYASSALAASGLYGGMECDPDQLTPSAVVASMRPFHKPPRQVQFQRPAERRSWCQRTWQSLAAMPMWLGWGCRELWALCW